MALPISAVRASGGAYFATIQRLSDSWWWNRAASAWQANPAAADRKVTLTEGSGPYLGAYTASVTGLGDAGQVRVFIHDDTDANDAADATIETYVWGGNEVTTGAVRLDATQLTSISGAVAGAITVSVSDNVQLVSNFGTIPVYESEDTELAFYVENAETETAWDLTNWTNLRFRAAKDQAATQIVFTLSVGAGLTLRNQTTEPGWVDALITPALLSQYASRSHSSPLYAELGGTDPNGHPRLIARGRLDPQMSVLTP